MLYRERDRLRDVDAAVRDHLERQLATVLYLYRQLIEYICSTHHRSYIVLRTVNDATLTIDAIHRLPYAEHKDRHAFNVVNDVMETLKCSSPALPSIVNTDGITIGVFCDLPDGPLTPTDEKKFLATLVGEEEEKALRVRFNVGAFPASCRVCGLFRHCNASCATRTPALHAAICLITMMENHQRMNPDVLVIMMWNMYDYIYRLGLIAKRDPAQARITQVGISDIRCSIESPAPMVHLARLYNRTAAALAPFMHTVVFTRVKIRDPTQVKALAEMRGSRVSATVQRLALKIADALCDGKDIDVKKQAKLAEALWKTTCTTALPSLPVKVLCDPVFVTMLGPTPVK
jgi:hypothetical protein